MAKVPALIRDDGWLEPYRPEIDHRINYYKKRLKSIEKKHGSLLDFASGDQELGLNYHNRKKQWVYREWAPAADALFLKGDFNNWEAGSHPLTKGDHGVWEIILPDTKAGPVIGHEDRLKVEVHAGGVVRDRIPAMIKLAWQDPETHDFTGQVWAPAKKFRWTDKDYTTPKEAPLIYECHTGMSTEKEGVSTYREFADEVLPRIHELGYNFIQVMAIQEHPYYGSFGYHVSSFFAPSSRFGSPDDLRYMINKAHKLGIGVIMDLVHSHAVKNILEGLNDFDGSGNQYFHEGGRGYHSSWDSKLFNYGKEEVLQFLLSNIRYWMDEFHLDGFRFDGVTSMLYFHHGDFVEFDHYDKYFKQDVDWDAVCYLQLANTLIHQINPLAVSIAEDMSGMPGLCRKPLEGGVGFDFRLGMGIPDYWIKLLKHSRDEDWNIHEIWDVLSNRRYKEKTIAYAESHDQALVGDKTLAFWLMDKEMYWHMSVGDDNMVIDRGIALHKMLRLLTGTMGGEGYMNFIGNEFGHPEWVDFPREGNDWSYKYARRQWSLVDNPELKYQFLNDWDKDMVHLMASEDLLDSAPAQQLNMDTHNNVIIYERKNLIFLFNFHVSNSVPDYRFYVPKGGKYEVVLNSDDPRYGGHDRVDDTIDYPAVRDKEHKVNFLSIYLPSRTALILKKKTKKS